LHPEKWNVSIVFKFIYKNHLMFIEFRGQGENFLGGKERR
jgi:hypothetical protein